MWSGLLCCALTWQMAHRIRLETGGMFVYPLDDTYIHLTLARTLAQHGVWGMSPAEFGSASSSPGWTLLLAATDLVFGPRLLTPIVLNLLLVFGVLYVADYALRRFAFLRSFAARFAILALLVVLTPLPSLALIGMEHVAQTFSIVLTAVFAAEVLAITPSTSVPRRASLLLLFGAALAGVIRYEAVFLILPIFLLALLRRRLRLALLVALAAAFGPVLFGLYSHHLSGFWLPFSVLEKVGFQEPTPTSVVLAKLIGRSKGVPVLLPMLALLLMRLWRRSFWEPVTLLLFLSSVVAGLHLLLAPIGWLMRYESYFVFLSLLSIAAGIASFWPETWSRSRWTAMPRSQQARLVLAIVGMLVIVRSIGMVRYFRNRGHAGYVISVAAGVDRFHQHVQMAEFVHRYYDHGTIVLNDIGAVGYYTDAFLLDLAGLGSAEPLLYAKRDHTFGPEQMAEWARNKNASIAILQPEWQVTASRTPPSWTLVEEWHLPRNVVAHQLLIAFYAVTPEQIPKLCADLAAFPMVPGNTVTLNRCGELAAK